MTKISSIGFNSGDNEGSSKVNPDLRNKISKESLFTKLDKNRDGKISDEELKEAGYTGKYLSAMSEALFFAERDVNKWFSYDRDNDSQISNVELRMWNIDNAEGKEGMHTIGDLTPEEFAKKYNMEFDGENYDDFEEWCKFWIESSDPNCGNKAIIKEHFGIELTEEETQLLYDAMKNQANRWLFKNKALYNRVNNCALTRLATNDQTVSCCGGDISKPPIGEQPKLNPDGTLADAESCAMIFSSLKTEDCSNSSEEVKNRLAWAAFKTVPETVAAKMTPKEYAAYQKDWQQVRNMKASDYRDLLKPENVAAREKFEETSNMTVQQIVDYIDIVETSTGKTFDSDDWSVDYKMFKEQILSRFNGTYDEESVLKGKTRADIPADRQEWLKYLEEHNLLLDQFKENL